MNPFEFRSFFSLLRANVTHVHLKKKPALRSLRAHLTLLMQISMVYKGGFVKSLGKTAKTSSILCILLSEVSSKAGGMFETSQRKIKFRAQIIAFAKGESREPRSLIRRSWQPISIQYCNITILQIVLTVQIFLDFV